MRERLRHDWLDWIRNADRIDGSRAAIDSGTAATLMGGHHRSHADETRWNGHKFEERSADRGRTRQIAHGQGVPPMHEPAGASQARHQEPYREAPDLILREAGPIPPGASSAPSRGSTRCGTRSSATSDATTFTMASFARVRAHLLQHREARVLIGTPSNRTDAHNPTHTEDNNRAVCHII